MQLQQQEETPRKTPVKKPRRALLKYLFSCMLLAFLAFTVLCLRIDSYGQQEHARPAQAIVVLGAAVASNHQPGDSLQVRTLKAVSLYKQHYASYIICTGGLGGTTPTEAEAAAKLAMREGVPQAAILLDTTSHSTYENAINSAAICRKHGWNTVIAVSDAYHLWRVRRDFRLVGIIAYTSPAYPCPRTTTFSLRLIATIREGLAVLRDYIAPA